MRIMGLDLGERRIGVALSDESQTLATPFEVIQRVSFAQLLSRIEQIAAEQHVESIVIGDPLSLNGEVGPQARHIAAEARRIQERLQLPTVLWDERLSTVSAEQLMAARGVRRRGARRKPIDAIVAAMILQEFLDARRAQASHGDSVWDE